MVFVSSIDPELTVIGSFSSGGQGGNSRSLASDPKKSESSKFSFNAEVVKHDAR